MFALGFLKSNWKLIAIAGAVLVLYLYWNDRTNTIKEQASVIVELKVQIETQNTAMVKLEEEKKIKDAKLKSSEEKSRQIRKETTAAVQRILDGIKPGTCAAAMQYLIEAVESGELKL